MHLHTILNHVGRVILRGLAAGDDCLLGGDGERGGEDHEQHRSRGHALQPSLAQTLAQRLLNPLVRGCPAPRPIAHCPAPHQHEHEHERAAAARPDLAR